MVSGRQYHMGRCSMPGSGRVVWVLGAGTSKHLDLPLLCEFQQFIKDVADHPDNQSPEDAPGREASERTIQCLSEDGINGNIETLLKKYPPRSDKGRSARLCVRWCFEKRHNAVFKKRDIPYKYKAYAYLLCCVRRCDSVVNFNYDLSVERTFGNARRGRDAHRIQPRIPEVCLKYLNEIDYCLGGILGGGARNRSRVQLIKIHGSLSFYEQCGSLRVGEKRDDVVHEPYIVYPDASKGRMSSGPGSTLVEAAIDALEGAEHVVIVGYSQPNSDNTHPFVAKLREYAKRGSIVLVSPQPSDNNLQLAKDAKTAVLWVNKFEEVFSCEQVRRFAGILGREPKLSG